MCEECKSWGDLAKAKVLVIGHDPNLHSTERIPEFCFCANYIKLKGKKKTGKGEIEKFNLASKTYDYVKWLTSNIIKEEEFYFTNLCNKKLPRPMIDYEFDLHEFYISRENAEEGLRQIRNILENSNIKLILATSLQVNYWLQKLDFYKFDIEFVRDAEPEPWCITMNCYSPISRFTEKKRLFYSICGEKFITEKGHFLFPILHIKAMSNIDIQEIYGSKLNKCIEAIKSLNIV